MRGLRLLISIALALGVMNLFGAPCIAEPYVQVTQCEAVSIQGDQYGRVAFNIHNAGDLFMISVTAIPWVHVAPGDTCHALDTSAPVGWSTGSFEDGTAYWDASNTQNAIPQGGSLSGFQIVMSGPVCCYLFLFGSVFDEPYAEETLCFTCDPATPARPRTWGWLKEHYR